MRRPLIRRIGPLAAVVALLALAGAPPAAFATTTPATAAGRPLTLTVWQGFKFAEVTLLRENIAAFTRDHEARTGQKVDVRVEQVPFADMVKRLHMAALARLTPDIAFVDANMMVPLAYGGVARPLDTLPNFPAGGIAALREQFVPGAFDTCVVAFRGARHLYGLPAQTTTLALFWNREMFRARADALKADGLDPGRPPRDWDEFVRYARALNDPARNQFGFGMNNSLWFTMPFLNQYGAEIVRRADGGTGPLEAAIPSPRATAAVTRKVNLYLKDKVEGGAWREGALDPDQGFLNRRYAMILTGPWQIENFRSSGIDFGVALIPRVPLAEAKALGLVPPDADAESTAARALTAGNIGGQNLVVCATSPHPEAALDLALHFAGEQVQRQWAEKLGQIPVNLAAARGLKLDKFPEVPVFIEQIATARPMPSIPYGSVLETEIVNPEMSLVLQGRQSPEQALQKAADSLRRRILDPVNAEERGR